jgi:hypothetical protein
MGKRRRHPAETKDRARPARALLRRIGGFGAALALALQLLLPFLAMPQAAGAGEAAALSQAAAAVWGRDAVLCAPGTARPHDGKQSPLAGHQCPVCWAMQQTASLLPPSAPPEPAPVAVAWVTALAPGLDPLPPLALSPAQPRGPPFV